MNAPNAGVIKACFANDLKGYNKLSKWFKEQNLRFSQA
jgi:hypothetical protein